MNRTHTIVLNENQILTIVVALRSSTVVTPPTTPDDIAQAIDQYREASHWPEEKLPPFETECVDPEGALAGNLSEMFEDLLHICPNAYKADDIQGFAL